MKSTRIVVTADERFDENNILYKHVFRNTMLIIIAGFRAFIGIFFTGSMLIEVMFSLEGIGLLAFGRRFNVVTQWYLALYIMTPHCLVFISELTYTWDGPRIDFEAR